MNVIKKLNPTMTGIFREYGDWGGKKIMFKMKIECECKKQLTH